MDTSLQTPAPTLRHPGQVLARGVGRLLVSHGFVCVEEFVPCRGLRIDVAALGPKGEIWVVECKSSRADFTSDSKWEGYLPWADRFFWAVDQDFPTEILPHTSGLMIADGYGGEIIRMGEKTKLPGARRRALLQKFATVAARRLQHMRDPDILPDWG
ncbi:MAG: MmcB family DNA repair protein [Pseudomonadota bacterium]